MMRTQAGTVVAAAVLIGAGVASASLAGVALVTAVSSSGSSATPRTVTETAVQAVVPRRTPDKPQEAISLPGRSAAVVLWPGKFLCVERLTTRVPAGSTVKVFVTCSL